MGTPPSRKRLGNKRNGKPYDRSNTSSNWMRNLTSIRQFCKPGSIYKSTSKSKNASWHNDIVRTISYPVGSFSFECDWLMGKLSLLPVLGTAADSDSFAEIRPFNVKNLFDKSLSYFGSKRLSSWTKPDAANKDYKSLMHIDSQLLLQKDAVARGRAVHCGALNLRADHFRTKTSRSLRGLPPKFINNRSKNKLSSKLF